MRFVGKVAIILVVVLVAAVAHSMQWPITRDIADALQRSQARRGAEGGAVTPPTPLGADSQTNPSATSPIEGSGEPQGQGDPPDVAPPPIVDEPDSDLPDYYISVARAYELWEEGMPFVDARTDVEREVGTIEGALHLETLHFVNRMEGPILAQLEPAFPVIVFCAGGECDASENVAQRLIGRGYTEVYIMHEGFGAWEAAGHPTEPVGGG